MRTGRHAPRAMAMTIRQRQLRWRMVRSTALLRIHDDTPSMDTPAGQIRDGIVDLIEGIPLGHQRLQVELAPFIPPDKGGEIAVRATQAPACQYSGALGNAEFLHIKAPQFLDCPHQTRGAAFLEADSPGRAAYKISLLGPRCANGVMA